MNIMLRLSGENLDHEQISELSPFAITAFHEKKLFPIQQNPKLGVNKRDYMNIDIVDNEAGFTESINELIQKIKTEHAFFERIVNDRKIGVLKSEFDIDFYPGDKAVENLLIPNILFKLMAQYGFYIDINISLYN